MVYIWQTRGANFFLNKSEVGAVVRGTFFEVFNGQWCFCTPLPEKRAKTPWTSKKKKK
jgi:hypothetical protein